MGYGEVVAVPRGERPLESRDDGVVRFARDLRLLRKNSGSPTYRALSARVHYSAAALSEAAGGRKLPTLLVTLAYVAGCGGDTAAWEARWRTAAAEVTATNEVTTTDGRAPYVGLAAFQQADADRFFGRDKLVAELVDRLAQHRFLGVFGASGCGKSSLLRAGLAACLAAGRGQDTAPVVVFTPGQHPIEECAIHLASFLDESPGVLREEFVADPRNLHLRCRQAATASGAGADVVLVVDQFEELFTVCGDERERTGFVDALVIAATDPASRVKVVLGVRADFLGHCGLHPRLVTALRDAQVLVGAMTTDELRLAITGPAEQSGYRVETALVARLIADATQQPGMLPLVSHALLQTWLRRRGTVMTLAAYDAAGGIKHALARTAEHVWQALDVAQQDVAKQMFLRLTALGEGTEDTRRRVILEELDHDNPNTALVLDVLTRARLITRGQDSVEIAHEALIRHWPRLRGWLADDREGHRVHRRLTEATTEWERHDRDDGLLYQGARLAAWQDRPLDRLNDTEHSFLTTSRGRLERERRSRRRRVRLAIGGLTTATAAITILAVVALVMAGRAESERAMATARQLVADARTQLQPDPELSLLLAREAYSRTPNADTEAVLRQAFVNSRVRAILPGGKGSATGVALSADGRHLAITAGQQLRVWDWNAANTFRTEPRVLRGLFRGNPAFSPDGRHVVVAGGYNHVVVRDWSRASAVTTVAGGERVAVHPDGQRIASGGPGGEIYLSNAGGDDRPTVLRGQDGPVLGLSFSPDGRLLVSGGEDGAIRVWDLVEGGNPVVMRGHAGAVNAVAFSPDARHLTSAGEDGTIRVWDLVSAGDPVVLGRHTSAVTGVTYSSDGHRIATASADRTVRVWNADHPTNPLVLRGHRDIVSAVAFSRDGQYVVSTSDDGTARIWEVDEVEDLTVRRGHDGPVRSVAASADGRYVVSGGQDGTVRFWDTTANRDPHVLHRQHEPIAQVAISADGRRLASVDTEGTARLWTTGPTGYTQIPLADQYSPSMVGMAFSPSGDRFVTTTRPGSLWLWDTVGAENPDLTPSRLYISGSGGRLAGVEWSPTGRHLASTRNGSVVVWDVRTSTEATVLPDHPGHDQALAFDASGTHLASGGNDGTIHLWNLTTAAQPTVLTGHQGVVRSLAFSRDGRDLVTSGDDATIHIWNTNNTSNPLVFNGFLTATLDIAALTDNRYATAHHDGTIRVWRCHACTSITDIFAESDRHLTRELTAQERRTYLH
jgi:WD40 repeat protein